MRKYQEIWEAVKKLQNQDQWVKVDVAHPDQIQTIINMVQLEKSREHTARKGLGVPAFGRLQIRREPEKKRVYFNLKNSGAQL
jgi:hypothetical protein